MADSRLTDKTAYAGTLNLADIVHIVDVSDTSQDPAGSSYKLPLSAIQALFGTATLATVLAAGRDVDATGTINTSGSVLAINVNTNQLRNGGFNVLDWSTKELNDGGGVYSLGWNARQLSGNWTIAGNFSPSTNNTRDLGTATEGWANLYLASKIHYSTDLEFRTGGVEKMRLTTGGRLGIGTISPTVQLHILTSFNGGSEQIFVQNSSSGASAITSIDIGEDANNFSQIGQIGTGNTTSAFGSTQDLYIRNDAGDGMNFSTFGSRIRFFPGANYSTTNVLMHLVQGAGVGINQPKTSTPDAILHAIGLNTTAVTFVAKFENSNNTASVNVTNAGNLNIASTQTTTASSTSGDVTFSQPFGGTAYKKIVIYLNASTGTTSYTFPIAFTNTPGISVTYNTGGGIVVLSTVVTSLSTTAVTVTGVATSGYITLEGY